MPPEHRPWNSIRIPVLLTIVAALSSCAVVSERDGPGKRRAPAEIRDAVPRDEARSKYGNPESYEVFGKRYYTLKTAAGFSERGIASWYGKKFHGRKTSSGEIYDMYQMTAAHKALPLPTYVRVTNLDNGRSAVIKVNDRGPFHENRIIDLSYAGALKLGFADKGTAFVEIVALDGDGKPTSPAVRPVNLEIPRGVYLQIGAFSNKTNASRLADRANAILSGKVFVREVTVAKQTIHRVQIGPIASVELADSLVAALRGIGIFEHHFVVP